jgi:Tol biopolymer transport system component
MRNEVYVRRYPLSPEQWQISNGGGESPMWSPDGKELFYASGDTIMRAPIGGGASLNAGTPAPLFRIPGHHTAPRLTGSVSRPVIGGITPDKQHFLFRLSTEQGLPSINVVLNWRKALRRGSASSTFEAADPRRTAKRGLPRAGVPPARHDARLAQPDARLVAL